MCKLNGKSPRWQSNHMSTGSSLGFLFFYLGCRFALKKEKSCSKALNSSFHTKSEVCGINEFNFSHREQEIWPNTVAYQLRQIRDHATCVVAQARPTIQCCEHSSSTVELAGKMYQHNNYYVGSLKLTVLSIENPLREVPRYS